MSGLPTGWAAATLGEITAPKSVKANPADLGELPFIGLEEVEADTGRVIAMQTTAGLKSMVALFEKGDLLYGRLRPYLNKVVLAEIDGAASAEFIVLPPSIAVDQRYLQSTLMSPNFVIFTGLRSTGDRPRVSFEAISDYELPLPPLDEQRRIVAKIDSLTGKSKRARDHLDHIPRLIEKYKQVILAAAFGGELTGNWRKARLLPEPRLIRLDEILAAPIRNGLSIRGSDTPPGVRSLRLSALRGGLVDLSDVRYLPIPHDRAERFFIKAGDVLVSRGNGTKAFVGLAALVGAVNEPTIFPDTAFRLRFDCTLVKPAWVARIWNAEPMRRQIEQLAKTTAGIWKIAQSDLDRLDIVLPCPAEQDEITRRLDTAFAWIDRLASQVTSARKLIDRLDQAVLVKAFRGELVPQDPDDEPASVLLERIKKERGAAPKANRGRKAA